MGNVGQFARGAEPKYIRSHDARLALINQGSVRSGRFPLCCRDMRSDRERGVRTVMLVEQAGREDGHGRWAAQYPALETGTSHHGEQLRCGDRSRPQHAESAVWTHGDDGRFDAHPAGSPIENMFDALAETELY